MDGQNLAPRVHNEFTFFHLLDRIGRQRHPLGATQNRQQHLDPLARLHPGIQADVARKRPVYELQAVTRAEFRWPWEIDQAAGLAPLERHDDFVRDGRRRRAVHDETDHPWRPSGGVPLQPNENEQVAGEK